MTTHTPRHWHFDAYEKIIVSKEVDWAVIARFDNLEGGSREVSYAEWHANGRLMRAAPALLEALEECITDPGANCIVTNDVAYMIRRFQEINRIARAALALAKGE